MQIALETAIRDAGIPKDAIGYVNGHGQLPKQEIWPKVGLHIMR